MMYAPSKAHFVALGLAAAAGVASGACTNAKSGAEAQGAFRAVYANESTDLSVCWLNGDRISPGARALLESKILEQFNGRTPIKFTFEAAPCSGVSDKAHVILAIDEGYDYNLLRLPGIAQAPIFNGKVCDAANLQFGGTYVFAPKSVLLNYSRQSIICQDTRLAPAGSSEETVAASLAFTALHELGHAVGLGHEHFRAPADATNGCWKRYTADAELWTRYTAAKIAEERLTPFGEYDPDSVMNYCNPLQNSTSLKDIALSAGDVATLTHLYARAASGSYSQALPPPNLKPAAAAADTGVAKAADPNTLIVAQPVVQPVAESTEASEFPVYCNVTKLRSCVVTYGGGAGCLDTARAQGECTRTADVDRRAVPYNETRACMATKQTALEKMACVD